MSPTTDAVRNQGFLPLECDIPPGMTLAEYRALRPRPKRRRRRAGLRAVRRS